MARYIDADALKREIVEFAVGISSENQDYYTGYISALSVVQGMLAYAPTLTLDDLRPKGRWNIVEIDKATNRITIECPKCGMVEEVPLTTYGLWRDFCPNCGADMRGGQS